MNKSESIEELATALAKAQGEFAGAVKDTANPFFKSKYADLESCVTAIKPHNAKHGLSFIQISHDAQNAACIETIIMHSSGEWLSAGLVSVPVSKQDAQGFGSAMTYARRYSLSAAFGIAPEDDDGNGASKAPASTAKQPAADFDKEIAEMKGCVTIQDLGKLWVTFDKPTQHALEATKENIKALFTTKGVS
jgi:hypothetical protein